MRSAKTRNLVAVILAALMVLTSLIAVSMKATDVSAATYEPQGSSADYNESYVKQQTISDFIKEDQTVISQREINDFEGNKFVLYELAPTGYAIYSIKGTASVFVEGALSMNSPFYSYADKDVVYLGFGEYYYEQDDKHINILTADEYTRTDLPSGFHLKEDAYYETPQISTYGTSFEDTPQPGKTVNLDGYVRIADHAYFENLTKFPQNSQGTCAIVAICIMLGYLDEYVNDGFIPDNYMYNGQSFKNGTGTSQALHDYMFNNCRHTILGIGGNGYPMANAEIKKTMRDYLNQVCGSDFEKKVEYVSGSLFFTHENPRKHINSGYPTLITMTSFKSSITVEKQEYHTVVAYGYNKNDDTFLVHMGWYPGRTTGAQVVVSDATIYSYNTFLYSE